MIKPKVSIVTIAYNQEAYIAQTLESFIMQKTNFNFEVIVADDCSIDKTPAIIREYSRKHPDIIKPVLRKKNIGAIPNIMDALKRAGGSYIALCEGDDYWTDPDKLQLQVNFLENNKGYSLVFHPVKVFFEKGEVGDSTFPNFKTGFTVERLLQQNFIQTNSVMYRTLPKSEYDVLATDVMPGDWYLHLFHAQFGEIGFIDRTMSAYRRHKGGLWWNLHETPEFLKKIIKGHLRLTQEILKIYSGDKRKQRLAKEFIVDLIVRTSLANNFDEVVMKSISDCAPELMSDALAKSLEDIDKLRSQNDALEKDVRKLTDINLKKSTEIDKIKRSESYRIGRVISYPIRKIIDK